MVEVKLTDIFEVRPQSIFASSDEEILSDFYKPLVGIKALMVYQDLKTLEPGKPYSHNSLILGEQSTVGEFMGDIMALEAVGLVRSFRRVDQISYFVYCLYSPKSPKEIFDDQLFIGTLKNYLDNDKISKLAEKYTRVQPPTDLEEITCSFEKYFRPREAKNEVAHRENLAGRVSGDFAIEFNVATFINEMQNEDPRFSSSSFSEDELTKITRLAVLYRYTEKSMAGLVFNSYNFSSPIGHRLDMYKLQTEAQKGLSFSYLKVTTDPGIHGDTSAALALRSMDQIPSIDYLQKLQHGNKPADSDIKLIEDLTVNMGLSQGACNALLVDMILHNHGILNRTFMTKIAGEMIRQNIGNGTDALTYLHSRKELFDNFKARKKKPLETIAPPVTVISSPDEEVSDSEFNDLMNHLFDSGDGK